MTRRTRPPASSDHTIRLNSNAFLVGLGAYGENVQWARHETFDNEGCLDDLKLTRHPKRQDAGTGSWAGEGRWYGDVSVPRNTGWVVQSERSLAPLATILGDTAMAARRQRRIEQCTAAVREPMWDRATGTFLGVHRDMVPLHRGRSCRQDRRQRPPQRNP